MEETPEIITKLVDFINKWNNPNELPDGPRPIEIYQLIIYDVSYNFIFKWIIKEKELKEASAFTKVAIENNTIRLSIGECSVELSSV